MSVGTQRPENNAGVIFTQHAVGRRQQLTAAPRRCGRQEQLEQSVWREARSLLGSAAGRTATSSSQVWSHDWSHISAELRLLHTCV